MILVKYHWLRRQRANNTFKPPMVDSHTSFDLSEFNDLGIILKMPTGVVFSTQAAGLGCLHPSVEGLFLPINTAVGRPELAALSGHFRGAWQCLSKADVHFLNRFFSRFGLAGVSVDAALLSQSYEAWVHVSIAADAKCKSLSLSPSAGRRSAVFTWPNSD